VEGLLSNSIFPTFFFAGFECSTFLWKDGKRKNYIELTGHDQHLKQDYQKLVDLGIGVVREAVPWPFVDLGKGNYDWKILDTILEELNRYKIIPIWDLFHYGLPDNCDPFNDDCHKRFLDYCCAVAERVVANSHGPYFFTPVNEITFYSAAATDMGWMYPFAKGKYQELKKTLCRFAIDAAKAIRKIQPDARMVHVDPLVHAVPPEDRPDLADEAWEHAYKEAYEAWDMLSGKLRPELGGSPEILDIVGVNVYNFSQAQLNADGSRSVLGPRDPRRKPLCDMLMFAWERYHRPIIIGETSGYQDQRAEWFRMTMQESLKALNRGIDLQGVCLYPCVDIPDWNTNEWAKIGIYDIHDPQTLERIPCDEYLNELRRWQNLLDQPQVIDEDKPGSVQLSEVKILAKKWEPHMGKKKWTVKEEAGD
jgi:beta-glucosidase/6-phospho-beta-glucosidase/beta-galactosidase